MSNRRKPKNQRRQRVSAASAAQRAHQYEDMKPWLWALQDADEAERRGDARGALDAMERRWLGPDSRIFWRPSRIVRLQQLMLLQPFLPGWMTSRWVLEQAWQHLDDADRLRGNGSRHVRALDAAVAARGGWDRISGRDLDDKRVTLRDRDWVYRQLLLYDFGGLEAFLSDAASPDLIAGADRVRDWASAEMGGYVFVEACGPHLTWLDLATHETVETPNIGTAAHLMPHDGVLGRLVPVGDEQTMFDGPVQYVGRECAEAVAAQPGRWLDLLLEAVERDPDEIHTGLDWMSLASDIPIDATIDTLSFRPDPPRIVPGLDATAMALAAIDLAITTMREPELSCPTHGRSFDIEDCGDCLDAGWEGWSRVHAGLLQPSVIGVLADVVRRFDLDLLCNIREELAEPARSLLGWHISRIDEAASAVA